MSTTPTEPGAADPAPAAPDDPAPAAATACPRCGTPLREDQEWCLNCGAAARTRVAPPSGWRAPVAIVAAVAALALAGLVIAFLAVSNDPDELTSLAQTGTQPAPAAGTPAPAPAAGTPTAVPSATPVPGEAGADPQATIPPASGLEAPAEGQGEDPPAGQDPDPTVTVPDDTPPATGGGAVGSWPSGRTAFTVVLVSSPTRSAAQSRAKELAAGGTEVGVLESDDYKSLRGGYFVVFSGQYDSRDEAETAAEGLQADAPGAYVRRVSPR